jgi:hypothetical protein
VALQGKTVTHPTVPCPEVKNSELLLISGRDAGEDMTADISEGTGPNGPLLTVIPRKVTIRESEIIFSVVASATFGLTNELIVGHETREMLGTLRQKKLPYVLFLRKQEAAA